ncbi:hypothetical protein NW761_002172 [Fusarium oxysporum]|nr:hypothetical protein NW763_006154 [Fusarium oxysporum]KAJ4060118.1 hypothetical protein NW758_000670 [Fusarium oxysporum]KAJ4063184.1 hypothetical protein NW753_004645 [Fusarium oxysporum]KAJ4103380.1 hypothetical protein NW761_002172 [Fusarium oxysporum]KAJ4104929.1 hypothetical protein NW756_000696 [Fusarium oxysporum]
MLFCISLLSSSLSHYLSITEKEREKKSGIIREEDFTVSIPWELETSWPTVALLIAANHDSSPFRIKQRVSNLQPEGSLSDDDQISIAHGHFGIETVCHG